MSLNIVNTHTGTVSYLEPPTGTTGPSVTTRQVHWFRVKGPKRGPFEGSFFPLRAHLKDAFDYNNSTCFCAVPLKQPYKNEVGQLVVSERWLKDWQDYFRPD